MVVEFQLRVKRARLVRKDLSQSGYDMRTRSRSANDANVWARASRQCQAALTHRERMRNNEKSKTHDGDATVFMKSNLHGLGISKNKIAKKVSKKAHMIHDIIGSRSRNCTSRTKLTKHPLRRSHRIKRRTEIRRSKLIEAENTKGNRKSCSKSFGELNSNSQSTSTSSTKAKATGKHNFDRVLLVKLDRLRPEGMTLKHPIDNIIKMRRGRPPKLSMEAPVPLIRTRRKYQCRSQKLEKQGNGSIVQTVKRKRGRPPLHKSSDAKAGVGACKKATRKYRRRRRKAARKPRLSTIELIVAALQKDPKEKRVTEIYRWMIDHYSYFYQEDRSWKNIVRHNLSMCPFFEKCEKRPEGGSAPWKLNLQHMMKWNKLKLRRRSKYLRSMPTFPTAKWMKILLKSDPETDTPQGPSASIACTGKTPTPNPSGEQFIEQVLNHYARKHNVTNFRGSSLQPTSTESVTAIIQQILAPECMNETHSTNLEVVPVPMHATLGYEDFGEIEMPAKDQTVRMSENLEWSASESPFFEDGVCLQKLTPIDYGDKVPEFEKMHDDDILNNNVPLIKIGSFEFDMYGDEDEDAEACLQ